MATDGYKRVRADAPIDALDDIDDWLSEVTYIMILAIFITGGAGVFSLDNHRCSDQPVTVEGFIHQFDR